MVGFFFTGSAVIGILVSQFLAGRSDKRGDRKSLIVFCCLLGVLACTLLPGIATTLFCYSLASFLAALSTANPQMFALAREHADKTGREAVMFSSFTRSGFTGMGHWPTAGLCLSDGFQLYGNVSERSGSVYCLRCDGVAVLPSMQKSFRWRPARSKRRAVTVAIRCCCLSFVH